MPSKQDNVASFLPYIRRIAHQIVRRLPPQVAVEDLISAGFEGLLDALNRFDATRADRLEQYAEYRVRGAMLDALRVLDPLGRYTRARSNKLAEVIRDLRQQLGRAPEEDEIAHALNCTVESYRQLVTQLYNANVLSLEDLVDDHGVQALPADPSAEDPALMAEHAETYERLVDAIGQLPSRHQTVLTLYYIEDLNFREIGEILEVTESRACQNHGEAIRALRALLTDPDSADEKSTELLAARIGSK